MNQLEFLRDVFKKYELTETDHFKSKQGWVIITRAGIEKIQIAEDIQIKYTPLRYDKDCVMLQAFGVLKERSVTTFASASDQNCQSKYYLKMAEKRALSRVVLKLIKVYQLGVFGEDEGVHLDIDEPAENWQIKQIDGLLRSSVYDQDERDQISNSLGTLSKIEATELLKKVKMNQQDPVTDGNSSAGDIQVKLFDIVKDGKK
jgi:hypothetical protein